MILNPVVMGSGEPTSYGIGYVFDMGIDTSNGVPQVTGAAGEIVSTAVMVPFPTEHIVTVKTSTGEVVPSNTTVSNIGFSRNHSIVFVMPQSDVIVTGTAKVE